jgi:hypothetical protein
MSVEIECPSGMQLRIRGLKGKEGRLLADKNALRQGTLVDTMLASCTEEIRDPGPYQFDGDKPNWDKVLIGDRFYTLLQIRLASFGADYSFKVQCREVACRQAFDWSIDLAELKIKQLSEADRATLRSGGIFTTTLGDGKQVKFRLATGADEKEVMRKRTVQQALPDMLALRIISIQGVGEFTEADVQQQKVIKGVQAYLDDLDWGELVRLQNKLEAHDCGVQTEIEIECPACSGVQEVQLPFDRGFFRPAEMGGSMK